MRNGLSSRAVALGIASFFLVSSLAVAQGKGKGRGHEPPGKEKEKQEEKASSVLPHMKTKGPWMPRGLTKEEQGEWKDGRPPGWSRGGKEGWKGGDMPPGLAKKVPPGWSKWNDRKRKQWEKELREAGKRIRRLAKKLSNFGEHDLNCALISVEAAAREGVPIKHAFGFVEVAMKMGMGGQGIEASTRAMAYGVGRGTDFGKLAKFMRKRLRDGRKGDELAIDIYKEISRNHK